ncbi:MAG: STAS domain-containing protein [Planctomycetaceae bacterium]|jgi:anti-anti-sigma regulatory factor|nr:STAS domain-containing protein [Planctomycetaceae bacterium]
MSLFDITSTNRDSTRDNALAQYVAIERYPKGLYARITCPTIGQREAPVISAEIAEAIASSNLPKGSSLVIDMSAVTMLTSMGLGMCVDLRNRANTAKFRPYLTGASRSLLDLFRMMKIDRLYTVVFRREELGQILG